MRQTRYSKWTGLNWDDVNLEELMEQLSDFLLQSGFERQFQQSFRQDGEGSELEGGMEEVLERLRAAIRDALLNSGILDDEQYEQLFDENGNVLNEKLEHLINGLIARLLKEGYLNLQGAEAELEWFDEADDIDTIAQKLARRTRMAPGEGKTEEFKNVQVKFEVTERGMDFLGYKTLQNLLGATGRASFGRHETDYLATGIEAYEASKPYEFGDTMNIDGAATLRSALAREGLGVPLHLEYSDLHVRQAEYQSSCATVVMLDCSHSMILYGEDRFTPAKKVALALSHLIRTQYPGDSLRLVLFHDSAEEVPFGKLPSLQVGPYHTNTCEGLKLAQRILMAERKDMRQIIMITDGKPSAMFLEDEHLSKLQIKNRGRAKGRMLYKNSMGLDPLIVESTLEQAALCRRSNILINTFMLTDDYYLVEFVKALTQIARGKAYFTTVDDLGRYVLYDFMRRKAAGS